MPTGTVGHCSMKGARRFQYKNAYLQVAVTNCFALVVLEAILEAIMQTAAGTGEQGA